MASKICKVLGVAFLIIGVIGFMAPGMAGTHLSPMHNIIHIVTGILAMWFGWNGSISATKAFCLTFGAVYGLLGIVGLFAPPGMPSMPGMVYSSHLLKVIPGSLELGTNDSVLHVVIGAFLLFGGLFKSKAEFIPPSVVEEMSREEARMR